ncbi:class F sortase [Kribbella sp. NPDC050241]|uniref:class F sortase n=1 Tax=Kribbella sp. NPDC050241 TaxID=3364115 RepID=UPI0037AA3322
MGRNRRTRRDRLASSRRGQVVVVVGVLLALLAGSVVFDRSTRDEASPTSRLAKPATSSAVARSENAVQSVPSRILLPQLALSARVIPIAAEAGVLTPPSNPRVVGWWSGGARPGDLLGSAVMTAHTVHTGGGAFDDLDQLRPGAIATVITSTGRITYVVTSVTNYPKRSLAKHAAELFDHNTQGRLVLVTCEDWNGTAYLSNTVVIAKPVP